MQLIHSKDIYYLICDTLKMFDRRPVVHGRKVAYYVYMMLRHRGGLEDYELADIVFFTTFHDIGAYRTDDIDQMVRYETKDSKPHSLYGQLIYGNLTLLARQADAIMHHHTDFASLSRLELSARELASFISLAEAIDIFHGSLGERFNLDIFKKQLGTKFSPQAFELFTQANNEYALLGRVASRAYLAEVEAVMDYFILRNDEKEKLIELLMFTLALKSDKIIVTAAICLALCEKLGALMKLGTEQMRYLTCAACLHDLGFMAFRKNWLEDPARLSADQKGKLAYHTILTEQLLKDRMQKEVIAIAAAHHERVDGGGYPRRLTEKQMNLAQLILQFADMTATMMTPPFTKEQVLQKVKRQVDNKCFSTAVATAFVNKYDEIALYAAERSEKILKGWRDMETQYKGAT